MIYKKADVPFELFYIDFRKADDDTLRQISKERGVALNLDNMRNIKAYYSKLDRAATDVEFETFGQVRSEHCLHPTFKG
ncbi:MAG: hypothetical protein ACE5KE_12100, partial [Methanosarcinales archaeon]